MLPLSGFLTVFRIFPRERFLGLKGTRERDGRGEGSDAAPQVGLFREVAQSGGSVREPAAPARTQSSPLSVDGLQRTVLPSAVLKPNGLRRLTLNYLPRFNLCCKKPGHSHF